MIARFDMVRVGAGRMEPQDVLWLSHVSTKCLHFYRVTQHLVPKLPVDIDLKLRFSMRTLH